MKFDHVILKKKIFSINEEDLLRQIEENLKEKFTDLKSHVGKISEDKNDNSYQQIISKIDDTYKEFKSVSKKFKESSIQTNSLKQILTDLTKTKESIIVSLKTFSEDDFKGVNKQVKKSIIEFYESCVNFIADFSVNHKLNVQIIEHSKYINILFEVEELFIEKEELTNNALLKTILEKVHGKMEMANISNYGTIINASVPLDLKHPDNSKADKRTRIIIAEDHDVSLFGLISLFKTKEDIEVIGTAKNGMEVLKLLETEDTDIVITDISMPGMDGIELAESLKNKHPQIKVIVFTMYLENWFVEQLINHGAKVFVSKNSKATELVSAVRSVMEGNNYYCPQFKSKFGFKGANNGITQKLDSLSKNELHIIKQYAENLSKEQIAEKMDISPKTMDNFIANILLKLNAGDEDEIIHIAKKQKFISE
ncbi:MAG: hypothetical protein C0597_09605 [Marinilabiliales bacterium]|nr:MAG: hypothetical protein C0597_09605 [Marinilabiliales bacterium]